jgi:RNA polymerase sigma factor (sigma-70 family)
MAPRGGQALADLSSAEGLGTTISNVRGSVARFSSNDSQDIVQEALTRAVAHDVRGNLEPWLRTVSRRIAIDNARRAREYAIGAADDVDKVFSPGSQSPEDIVLNNEGVGMIRRAMRSLPVRYRDALLAYSQEGDNGAVAEHFGISSNATCSLLCRARSRLREELDRVGYAFGAAAMKLQRWHREVATAAAGACFVAVVAGSSGAVATPAAHEPVPAPAVAAAPVVTSIAPVRAVAASAVQVIAPVRAVVRDVVKRTEVVRYQVVACGLRGKPVVAPYATIVKDGHPSIVGSLATNLPKLPVMDTGTCR